MVTYGALDHSKLDLSAEGLRLLTKREPWNEKRLLFDGLYNWFGHALTQTKQRHGELFNGLVGNETNGKITRGDNYNGFPYVLLDYPNLFSRDEIVAARNMVWLGNGFHCTLHVRGSFGVTLAEKVASVPPTRFDNIRILTGDDEWQHHVEPNNWKKLADATPDEHEQMKQRRWLKLGCELNIHQPDSWNDALASVYQTWADVLSLR